MSMTPEEVRAIAQEEMKNLRKIVREEIEQVLRSMSVLADNLNGHDTGQLEAAGLAAVGEVADRAIMMLPHGKDCELRASYWNHCDCHLSR